MPDTFMQAQVPERNTSLPIQWLSELQGLHERLKPCFPSRDSWSHAGAYLVGLLSGVERKNAWQMSEEVGEATPYALQHLLGRAKWDASCVRDQVRTYIYEHLADPQGVLILDETGFLKKGTKSVGVSRQYTGTAGRIENAQVGVFLAYASRKGHALIDRALYLPDDWAKDPERRKAAGIPEEVAFHTKSQLGQQMLARAFEAGIPHTWVTADEVYGRDGSGLRHWLETIRTPYVMATAGNQYVWLPDGQYRASNILKVLEPKHWSLLSSGDGSKGPRCYEWAGLRTNNMLEGWERWLLFRRSISDGEVDYFIAAGPEDTPLEELVRIAGMRWSIEMCFEEAKGEVGLDQYEVRSWTGWYRHITLSMTALAYLAVLKTKKGESIAIEGRKGQQMKEFRETRARRAKQK